MCYSLRKRAGRIVFLNHPRCPCHAPNYDASCAAPRCASPGGCGKQRRGAPSQAGRGGRGGRAFHGAGTKQHCQAPTRAFNGVSLSSSLPPVLEFLSPSSAATPRRACKPRFPLVFFPPPVPLPPPPPTIPSVTSQNLSLISAQLSGVALSVLTAGGRKGGAGARGDPITHSDLHVERFVTNESSNILKLSSPCCR